MLYDNVKEKPEGMGLYNACSALNVSRHSYKNWLKKPAAENKDELLNRVLDIGTAFPRYGYRRITAELRRQGIIVNHKKVLKTMRKHGLLAKQKKRFKLKTTDSEHGLCIYPNLAKGLTVTKLNQVWVADITYIGLQREFVYLAVLVDLFSRKCIGWQLSRNVDARLCLDALQKALRSRKKLGFDGLIHHSDQGVQYASNEYVELLKHYNIRPSMSARGYAYDNAHAESFIKTVKYDEVHMNEYLNFEDAYRNIKKFIEEVYNKKRLHSAIGYKPPAEFEREVLNNIVA